MKKLHQLLDGVAVPATDTDITALVCDSRKVVPGCAFVCIDGVTVDGHTFAAAALEAGAAALIVQRDLGLPHQVLVDDTRLAWAVMSANWFDRPADRLKVIGVTGTNGKTSTTYMIKQMLEACGYKVGLCGTIQNLIGDRTVATGHTTPDAYELQSLFADMLAEHCDYAVMEVSSHALDQHRVAAIPFVAGIFTNLTQDHLDYHKTMENYCDAKRRLFEHSAVAVVQANDPWTKRITAGLTCPILTFSNGKGGQYTADDVAYLPDGVAFTVNGPGVSGRVHLAIPGEFSVCNAMGAIVTALAIGLPFDTVCAAVGRMTGVKGRAEIVPTGRDFTVVIDYAHTPDGLEKICQALRHGLKGRLVTLFGCGGDRDRTKRPKMGAAAAALSDFVIVSSDNPRSEDPEAIIDEILPGIPESTPYVVIPDRAEAVRWAIENAQPDDTILLAGKGHETYQIIKTGSIHLDEREIIAEALQGKKD